VTAEQAVVEYRDLTPVVDLETEGLTSDNSKRAYSHALTRFLTWLRGQGLSDQTSHFTRPCK
jgi:hypothetical protein